MHLISKIKQLNPICRAMNEFRQESASTRQLVLEKGHEAIKKVLAAKMERKIVEP